MHDPDERYAYIDLRSMVETRSTAAEISCADVE